MIRLLLFSLIPFIITVAVIYFVLTLINRVIRVFRGLSRPFSRSGQSEEPLKPKETYKDVQDAKFVELPNKQEKDKAESEP
jgi:hypothetical protein